MIDKNPFDAAEFRKMLDSFQVPNLNMQNFAEVQRKNIEALTHANKIAMEGAQALLQRQSEILRQSMEETTHAMQQMVAAGSPEEKIAKQYEMMKSSFEHAVANLRELGEMTSKSNTEALETLNKRFADALEEMKAAVSKSA